MVVRNPYNFAFKNARYKDASLYQHTYTLNLLEVLRIGVIRLNERLPVVEYRCYYHPQAEHV